MFVIDVDSITSFLSFAAPYLLGIVVSLFGLLMIIAAVLGMRDGELGADAPTILGVVFAFLMLSVPIYLMTGVVVVRW